MDIRQIAGIGTVATNPYAVGTASGSGSTSTTSSSSASSVYGLGKDDFFKLFLAQLKNQDPTNPMDDSQMVGQLAQFSMIEMLQQLTSAMQGSQLAQASALIGRTVSGTDSTGTAVTGVVDHVTQTDNGLVLAVGSQTLAAKDVTSVADTPAATPTTGATGSGTGGTSGGTTSNTTAGSTGSSGTTGA